MSLKQQKYPQAVISFDKLLELEPNNLPAKYFLAVAHYRQGNVEQADQLASAFRAQAPQYPGGHRLYAAIKFTQGEFAEAQEILEDLLSFEPDDRWVLGLLADIAIIRGNPEQSIESYRRIVELDSGSSDSSTQLALGLMMTDPAESRELLQSQAERDGASPQLKALVIVSYLKAGEWDEAIAAASELTRDMPENWDAYTLLGGAYLGNGEDEKARVALTRALELQPGNPNAANNLARLELDAGNDAAARALYEQILKAHPERVAPVLFLSALDQQNENFEDALQRLEVAVAAHPKDLSVNLALARLNLRVGQPSKNISMSYDLAKELRENPLLLQVMGDSQFALGQFDAAADIYEKLIAQIQNDAGLYYRLGRTYAAQGQLSDANAQLQKVNQIDPQNYSAKILRVHLLRLENKSAQASQLLNELVPEYEDRPEILIEQGWLAMYQNKFEEAVTAFQKALEQAPDNTIVVQLGAAQWNAGDKAATVDGYEEWLRANPDDMKVKVHLANTYLQWGKDDEAIAAFEELLGLNPENPVVLNNLAWLLRERDSDRALKYAETSLKESPNWAAGLDTMGSIRLARGENDLAP